MENSPASPLPDQDGIDDSIPAELRSSILFTKRSVMMKHLHLHPELRNLEEIQLFVADDNNGDGFKTPPDRTMKPILKCPGAPRKKKIVLQKRMKRKSACSRKLVFDSLKEKTLEDEISINNVHCAGRF